MIDLSVFYPIIQFNRDTTLVAPTGHGKTTFLLEVFDQRDFSMVYLSPLRALAEEFYERALNEFGKDRVVFAKKVEDFQKYVHQNHQRNRMLVCTIESVPFGFLEELALTLKESILVVFDEVHLFHHWGETFRPVLLDRFYEVKFLEFRTLSLTATLNQAIKEHFQLESDLSGQDSLIIDLGNYGLKTDPEKVYYFQPNQKKVMEKTLWYELHGKSKSETFLVFVAYRYEVDELCEYYQRRGFRVLGCVSGEVESFRKNLIEFMHSEDSDSLGTVDLIVSTSCLSHGVNLPPLSRVFLFYPVPHRDFWIQMVGRGGRRGEKFQVYEMNGYNTHGKKKKNSELWWQGAKNHLLSVLY